MKASEHLLICLAEECAEISENCARLAIRVSKALRFGVNEVQQGQIHDNLKRITLELADLKGVIEILEQYDLITNADITTKKIKLEAYLEYAIECGTIDDLK